MSFSGLCVGLGIGAPMLTSLHALQASCKNIDILKFQVLAGLERHFPSGAFTVAESRRCAIVRATVSVSRGERMARDQRRLAAIVSADVVGFSCLMGVDGAGTFAGLKSHLQLLFDPEIVEYGGRIVKSKDDLQTVLGFSP